MHVLFVGKLFVGRFTFSKNVNLNLVLDGTKAHRVTRSRDTFIIPHCFIKVLKSPGLFRLLSSYNSLPAHEIGLDFFNCDLNPFKSPILYLILE